MPIYPLYRRWKPAPFTLVEADCPSQAIENVARGGFDLTYADLRGIAAPLVFLPGVDLRGADMSASDLAGGYFRGADLRASILVDVDLSGGSLREADVRNAELRHADLRRADLRGARFSGADLRGVRLTGARIDGAVVDWRWSAFAVELLRRDAGCRGDGFRLVSELAFEDDERPFGWLRSLTRKTDSLEWAVVVLGRAIVPGDNAPELLRRLAADTMTDASSAAPAPTSQVHWVRRSNVA